MKPDRKLNEPLELCGYIDAEYAGDNYSQKSVTRYIVLINGVVIAWCSGSQKIVTLSVTEAKYSEITEVCF